MDNKIDNKIIDSAVMLTLVSITMYIIGVIYNKSYYSTLGIKGYSLSFDVYDIMFSAFTNVVAFLIIIPLFMFIYTRILDEHKFFPTNTSTRYIKMTLFLIFLLSLYFIFFGEKYSENAIISYIFLFVFIMIIMFIKFIKIKENRPNSIYVLAIPTLLFIGSTLFLPKIIGYLQANMDMRSNNFSHITIITDYDLKISGYLLLDNNGKVFIKENNVIRIIYWDKVRESILKN